MSNNENWEVPVEHLPTARRRRGEGTKYIGAFPERSVYAAALNASDPYGDYNGSVPFATWEKRRKPPSKASEAENRSAAATRALNTILYGPSGGTGAPPASAPPPAEDTLHSDTNKIDRLLQFYVESRESREEREQLFKRFNHFRTHNGQAYFNLLIALANPAFEVVINNPSKYVGFYQFIIYLLINKNGTILGDVVYSIPPYATPGVIKNILEDAFEKGGGAGGGAGAGSAAANAPPPPVSPSTAPNGGAGAGSAAANAPSILEFPGVVKDPLQPPTFRLPTEDEKGGGGGGGALTPAQEAYRKGLDEFYKVYAAWKATLSAADRAVLNSAEGGRRRRIHRKKRRTHRKRRTHKKRRHTRARK